MTRSRGALTWSGVVTMACLVGAMACGEETPGLIGRLPDSGFDPPDMRPFADAFVPNDARVGGGRDAAMVADAGRMGPDAPNPVLAALIDGFDGQVSLYGRNLVTGAEVADRADSPRAMGELFRFFVAVTYARQVADGMLDPDAERIYDPGFERSPNGILGDNRHGATFRLKDLARFALASGDRSAEALLLDAVGGADTVQATIGALGVPGFGRYRSPCERDRIYASALDARFAAVDCVRLGRYLHGNDDSAISPDPFATPPEFTPDLERGAWATVVDTGTGLATARAWGALITEIYAGRLFSQAVSDTLRDLLERGLGSGGGGDNLPPNLWVGNITSSIPFGRHWLGLITPAGEAAGDPAPGGTPFVLVILTEDHDSEFSNAGGLFIEAGLLSHEQIVGPVDLAPPAMEEAAPEWLEGLFLVEAAETSRCNDEFAQDFDLLLQCRQGSQRARFVEEEETAGAVMVREGPLADVAWFWTQPDGSRHRYQQRLDPGGWWAWTRSFRAFVPGLWRLDIYVNGRPYMLKAFPVDEAP